jgi:hypothetical protein
MALHRICNRIWSRREAWVLLALLAVMPGVSLADGAPNQLPNIPDISGWSTNSFIGGNAVSDFTGFAGVNMAAGQENLQSNSAAIALGGMHGRGLARAQSSQSLLMGNGSLPDSSRATISDGAFAHGTGVFSINQASGMGNAQANGIAIGVGGGGIQQMSDVDLAQSVTVPASMMDKIQKNTGHREAVVSEQAFNGTRGIVQVNQAAGAGNATANGFSLNVGAGVR